jgi:hypothetical protein
LSLCGFLACPANAQQTILAFDPPSIDCLDLGAAHFASFIHAWLCPQAPASRCGIERWPVKTLADPNGPQVFASPVTPVTIQNLTALPAPSREDLTQAVSTRFPAELRLQRVHLTAVVLGYKLESDRDIHIVLADPSNAATTMVAEIPDSSCVPATYRNYFAELRKRFVAEFGQPHPRMRRPRNPEPMEFTGVFFFDFLHGQTGVAPNGAELHPLLDFKAVKN